MKLQQDLREFIELLNSHGSEYLVVGGHAVAFHGHPRFTGDIDFLVRPSEDNAARVLEVLRAFGFGELALTTADLIKPGSVVQLGRPPNRIDLLTSISGVSFDEAWAGRVPGKLDGLPVFFLGWEALLENKRASIDDCSLRHGPAFDCVENMCIQFCRTDGCNLVCAPRMGLGCDAAICVAP